MKPTLSLLIALLLPSGAWASSPHATTGDPCGQSQANTPGNHGLRKQYCDEFEEFRRAAKASGAVWKIWAGVAAVCTTACIGSAINHPIIQKKLTYQTSTRGANDVITKTDATVTINDSKICVGANLAGAATESIVTKDYMAAVRGIGETLLTQLALPRLTSTTTKDTDSNKQQPQGAKPKFGENLDFAACLTALSATQKTYASFKDQKTQKEKAEEALNKARNLAATQTTNENGVRLSRGNIELRTEDSEKSDSSSTSPGATGSAMLGPDTQKACQGKNAGAMLQCALASDRSLPRNVGRPEFQKDFETATGAPLNKFLEQDRLGPTEALGAMMGGGNALSFDSKDFKPLLAKLEEKYLYSSPSPASAYASRGGAARGGSSSNEGGMGDLGDVMKGLLGQLVPGEEGAKEESGPEAMLEFGAREPASEGPEGYLGDSSVSIFARVSQRIQRTETFVMGSKK
jgi:hypothetical protein